MGVRYPQPVTDYIFCGPSPKPHNGETVYRINEFKLIINVSDTPELSLDSQGLTAGKHLWFPISEAQEWPLPTLDAICQALDWAQAQKLVTYVHCHAGACRAPTTTKLWKYTRDLTIPIAAICKDEDIELALMRRQILPEFVTYLRARLQHPTYATDGALQATMPEFALKRRRLKARPLD